MSDLESVKSFITVFVLEKKVSAATASAKEFVDSKRQFIIEYFRNDPDSFRHFTREFRVLCSNNGVPCEINNLSIEYILTENKRGRKRKIQATTTINNWTLQRTSNAAFNQYQENALGALKEKAGFIKVAVNLHPLLSLSGIAYINYFCQAPSNLIESIGIRNAMKLHKKLLIRMNVRMKESLFNALKNILHDYEMELFSYETAQRKLLKLMKLNKGNKAIYNTLRSIHSLINDLPKTQDYNMSEIKLIYRIVKSVFVYLFNNTDDIVDKSNEKYGICQGKRADFKGYATLNNGTQIISVVGEVKRAGESEEKIARDIYRLGVFSKNGYDEYNLQNMIAFMAVGSNVSTFLMDRLDCYYFFKMLEFDLPLHFKEITKLLGCADKMAMLAYFYINYCNPTHDLRQKPLPTLPIDTYEDAVVRIHGSQGSGTSNEESSSISSPAALPASSSSSNPTDANANTATTEHSSV